MAVRLAFIGVALLIACRGQTAPAEPAPVAPAEPPAPPAAYPPDDVPDRADVPSRAVFAEGPSPHAEVIAGPCKDYVDMTLRCMEQMASAGTFPIDQLDQIRAALEQTLQARADASPEQRDAMDQACLTALQQQPWSQSGCTP